MKNRNISASVLLMAVLCLTMISGSFAANNVCCNQIHPKVCCNQTYSKEISVRVNESFEISLKSNPSTGYTWMDPIYDSEYLTLTGSTYILPPLSNVSGAPGTQVYTFKALKAGDTEIKLIYKRPWENCIGKITIYHINITE